MSNADTTTDSSTDTSTTARAFGDAITDVLAAVGGNARTVEELDAVVDQRSASAVLTEQRARLLEMGLPGLLAPEASGGSGVLEDGEAFAALVAVARAAGAVPGPDIAGPWAVAPTVLRLAGADEELVSAVASGEERLAIIDLGAGARETSPDEPGSSADRGAAVGRGSAPDQISAAGRSSAVGRGSGGEQGSEAHQGADPSGTVRIVDADDADGVLVLAPGRVTLVRDVPLTPASSFDPTRPVSTVSRTRLGGGDVLAEGAEADRIARVARAVGRVVLAAELHGTGQELLRLAVEHLQTRMAFGRPLGSFQALKHRAADLWSELSLVGSLIDEAASRLEELLAGDVATAPADSGTATAPADAPSGGISTGVPEGESADPAAEAPAYAAAALSLAADTVVHAGEEVLQLHGGIGYTWESPIHILLKRAVVTRGRWGTPHELRRIVAAQFDL